MSIIEGTRFGYANELDLGLRFEALQKIEGDSNSKNNIAFKVGGDPFTLKKADTSQTAMDRYFDSHGEFQAHKFKCILLKAIDNLLKTISKRLDLSDQVIRLIMKRNAISEPVQFVWYQN